MRIIKAGLKDCPALAEMNFGLIRDEGHRNPMKVPALTRRMRGWLRGEYQAYLFEEQGKTIGYTVFLEEKDFLCIRQFYIVPKCRRKGLGRSAFEAMRRKVWRGKALLRLDVLTKNRRGTAFWRSVGFEDYCLTLERKNR